jgi:hypothetical protein
VSGAHRGYRAAVPKRRTVLTAALAVLGLSIATPAGARPSPYAAVDPNGDVPAKADIRRYRVEYGDTVRLDVRLREGTDPHNGPPWEDRLTGVLWQIKVPGGDSVDYAAFFYNGGPGVLDGEVDLYEPPLFNTKVCETTETFHDGNGYRLEFVASCIGSPEHVRVQAAMMLDKPPPDLDGGIPGLEDEIDFAPDSGFTPKIKKEGS